MEGVCRPGMQMASHHAPEQFRRIDSCLAGKFLHLHPPYPGQEFGHGGKITGFVGLAPMGNGRQVRGIGLDQEPVDWNAPGDLAQGVGITEGDDPAEADHEAQIEQLVRHGCRPGETVQDP